MLCKHEVVGSIPSGSTRFWRSRRGLPAFFGAVWAAVLGNTVSLWRVRAAAGYSYIVKRKYIRLALAAAGPLREIRKGPAGGCGPSVFSQ